MAEITTGRIDAEVVQGANKYKSTSMRFYDMSQNRKATIVIDKGSMTMMGDPDVWSINVKGLSCRFSAAFFCLSLNPGCIATSR
ncbi:hypothetical protein BPAE_0071g00420 [Botrytis paeoniae]|uniref:Uncharacterized protein n=1 Tax=Botrytis paeoniae TaxID=278948 RepID=A0A4Z1FR75_9HELO|nr:hypothetical protein BPAE_0071g00420 [Botrytis paeoniae]